MGNPNEGSGKGASVQVAPLPDSSPGDQRGLESKPASISARIQGWSATALVVSYFVFSIALYTVLDLEATKIFWFLYLTIATLIASTTALEAYDGLTPLKDARNATAKFEKDGQKFKTSEDALPLVELVFDLQDGDLHDLNAIKQVRNSLLYPSSLIRINVMCHDHGIANAIASDYDGSLERAGVRVHLTPPHAMASLSARLAHFLSAAGPMAASIMAVFAGDQRPHPHAMRIAVERMKQDAKVDVLQGRIVRVPQGRRSSFFAALANIEHDMVYALLRPGRAITWALNVANDTNTYWRTETLRAATGASIGVPRTGHDVGYTAASQGSKTVNDLRLICFEPCPSNYGSYLYRQATEARQWVLATVRYTTLAFKKHGAKDGDPSSKWSLKTRFAILYELVILRLGSHAIAQYVCMALALLFTRSPNSTLQFAYLIYFPYPISEWFMIAGLVCLISTVFMIHSARSEFVPAWTSLALLPVYPLLLVYRAVVDVYAQLDILVA